MPQTSQSWSSERGGGSADAADDEAGADADAAAAAAGTDADADAAWEEGGVGEEGVDNDGDVSEVDGPVAALGCFPPFFFVMAWCVGVLEA